MPTEPEMRRLAGAINKLRPEWRAQSIYTYLAAKHSDRAYQDLATALTILATDPTTQTPARLEEHGYWWLATRFNAGRGETPDVGPGRGVARCTRPGHEHEAAHACRACRAERLAGDTPEETP